MPRPGEFGQLLCAGGNLGCLSQSRATLSQKLALMRAVGPVSFQDCALKQHEAEKWLFPPWGDAETAQSKRLTTPTLSQPPAGKTTLYSRLLSKCFPLPE